LRLRSETESNFVPLDDAVESVAQMVADLFAALQFAP